MMKKRPVIRHLCVLMASILIFSMLPFGRMEVSAAKKVKSMTVTYIDEATSEVLTVTKKQTIKLTLPQNSEKEGFVWPFEVTTPSDLQARGLP